MYVDFIILGQGIAGTLLSHTLLQAGQSVLVVDEYKPDSASRVAAGVINPVSGRRFTMAWMYDEIYPVAAAVYRQLEQLLDVPVFRERDIWNVLPSEQLRDAFLARTMEGPASAYIRMPDNETVRYYDRWLEQPFGAAIVKGATVLLGNLLPAWRAYLAQRQCLLEERMDLNALEITPGGVKYRDISARCLVCCEGAQTVVNPWFRSIPFLLNKGETLQVRIPGFVTEDIVKRSISLVPQGGDTYWVGATFAWDYADERPTREKREYLENGLQQLLKAPYEVLDQQAAIRPSGTDRRPMMGLHPEHPSLGIFNGLGTKGSSLAPAMAARFVGHLLRNEPLWPETDIKRFFNR